MVDAMYREREALVCRAPLGNGYRWAHFTRKEPELRGVHQLAHGGASKLRAGTLPQVPLLTTTAQQGLLQGSAKPSCISGTLSLSGDWRREAGRMLTRLTSSQLMSP